MKYSHSTIWMFVIGLVLTGCRKSTGPSGGGTAADPKALAIETVSPVSGGKNTTLTIVGANFSTNAADDQVFINGHPVTVTAATSTTLIVTVPVKTGTGIVEVKKGSETAKGPVFTYEYNYYTVSTLAGSSQGFADGQGSHAQFDFINGIAIDTGGNVIVADAGNYRIRRVDKNGTVITIAGTGGTGNNDGSPGNATFGLPWDVAVDQHNNIYISDADNNNIREMEWRPLGYVVSTLAGPMDRSFSLVDGVKGNARFAQPGGMAIDTLGNLYVADQTYHAIRRITVSDGSVITMAGGSYGGMDGYGTAASFGTPMGLDVSLRSDSLFVIDNQTNKVRKLSPLHDPATTYVSTFVAGRDGYRDGGYTDAEFRNPRDIVMDEAHHHLFIADADNNCIRVIDTKARTVSTLTGSPNNPGPDNGPVSSALFNQPSALAVDKEGNLYIADQGNFRIRRIAYE